MDTNLFFPGPGEAVATEVWEACQQCPVRTECRHHALVYGEYGHWGSSQKERRQVRSHNSLRVTRITTHDILEVPQPSIEPEVARRRAYRRRARPIPTTHEEVRPDGIEWQRR